MTSYWATVTSMQVGEWGELLQYSESRQSRDPKLPKSWKCWEVEPSREIWR